MGAVCLTGVWAFVLSPQAGALKKTGDHSVMCSGPEGEASGCSGGGGGGPATGCGCGTVFPPEDQPTDPVDLGPSGDEPDTNVPTDPPTTDPGAPSDENPANAAPTSGAQPSPTEPTPTAVTPGDVPTDDSVPPTDQPGFPLDLPDSTYIDATWLCDANTGVCENADDLTAQGLVSSGLIQQLQTLDPRIPSATTVSQDDTSMQQLIEQYGRDSTGIFNLWANGLGFWDGAANLAQDAITFETMASAAADSAQFSPLDSWGNPGSLYEHFVQHGAEFGATSQEQYAFDAQQALSEAMAEDPSWAIKVDSGGTINIYQESTNTFGAYNGDGTTRTFFKPDQNMYPGTSYFDAQAGYVWDWSSYSYK
jgi:hypothetical protein